MDACRKDKRCKLSHFQGDHHRKDQSRNVLFLEQTAPRGEKGNNCLIMIIKTLFLQTTIVSCSQEHIIIMKR